MNKIIWSPSSWALWKQCPAKFRMKHLNRWSYPKTREDSTLSRLAIPGLAVDKLLQLWLHRNQFHDQEWLQANFDMIWEMVLQEINPIWPPEEARLTKDETLSGLVNAVGLLSNLPLQASQRIMQANFFEPIDEKILITGAADLLLIDEKKQNGILVDFKNNHSRTRMTKDQLVIYQLGLEMKHDIDIHQAGYLMFNPRMNDWKWFNLKNPAHKQKMVDKLIDASEKLIQKQFEYRWNMFTCTRFCEVRMNCELFQEIILKKNGRKP